MFEKLQVAAVGIAILLMIAMLIEKYMNSKLQDKLNAITTALTNGVKGTVEFLLDHGGHILMVILVIGYVIMAVMVSTQLNRLQGKDTAEAVRERMVQTDTELMQMAVSNDIILAARVELLRQDIITVATALDNMANEQGKKQDQIFEEPDADLP